MHCASMNTTTGVTAHQTSALGGI